MTVLIFKMKGHVPKPTKSKPNRRKGYKFVQTWNQSRKKQKITEEYRRKLLMTVCDEDSGWELLKSASSPATEDAKQRRQLKAAEPSVERFCPRDTAGVSTGGINVVSFTWDVVLSLPCHYCGTLIRFARRHGRIWRPFLFSTRTTRK